MPFVVADIDHYAQGRNLRGTARSRGGTALDVDIAFDSDDIVLMLERAQPQVTREQFDAMIGRLDRLLSEFLTVARSTELDEPDLQTLKHHADDLIGVGQAALDEVKPRLRGKP